MPTGKVKWFNNAKGYGFILPGTEDNGEDLFVHYSSINMEGYKTLKAGQLVSYEIIQGPKGLHAINIGILEAEVSQDSEAAPASQTSSETSPQPEPEEYTES